MRQELPLFCDAIERKRQRVILWDMYPDYKLTLHWKYVVLYNKELKGEKVKL